MRLAFNCKSIKRRILVAFIHAINRFESYLKVSVQVITLCLDLFSHIKQELEEDAIFMREIFFRNLYDFYEKHAGFAESH